MSSKSRVLHLMLAASTTLIAVVANPANAAVLTYGDMDCLGQGCYGAADPTSGATLQGLGAGATTFASTAFGHAFPFSPGAGDFHGTDTIYVGSNLTHADDGYAANGNPVAGPQVLTLDYGSIVPGRTHVTSLTLGIAMDDFQSPFFHQPFIASINGAPNADLTALLNSIDLGGPRVEFVTLGIDLSQLDPSNVLRVSIDEGGDGGDGWAIDFATVGVTTAANVVPEPMTLTFFGAALASMAAARRRKRLAS